MTENKYEVSVSDLTLEYPPHDGARAHTAVHGVSFNLAPGAVLALLGESGSGKSTLARTLAGRGQDAQSKSDRVRIVGGSATVRGLNVASLNRKQRTILQREVGYLAQDDGAKLPPELTIADVLMQPVRENFKRYDATRVGQFVTEMFDIVQLPLTMLQKMPHELSKGQRQRIAVMRSLMLEPHTLIADEPTIGIDVTARPAIVELLKWFSARRTTTMLLICHDITALEQLAEEVLILQQGQTVGAGNINTIFRESEHRYVQQLAAALRATAYDESAERKLATD